MIDIILFTISYLLFGLAFVSWLSEFEGREDGAPFWLAFVAVCVSWPIFVALTIHYWMKARNDR